MGKYSAGGVVKAPSSVARLITRNVLSNAGGNLFGSFIQLFLVTVLARILEVPIYAGYLTAVAVIGVGEMASDFGTRIMAVKGFASSSEPLKVFRDALTSKLFYSFLAGICFVLIPFQNLTWTQVLICFLIASSQPSTDPLIWHLRGRERMDIEALIFVCWRMGVAFVLTVMALGNFPLNILLGAWLGINILRIVIETRLSLSQELFKQTRRIQMLSIKETIVLVRSVFPLGLSMLLMTIFYRLGVISLGYVGSDTDVAIFGTAFTLVVSSGFISTSITISLFPRLSRALEDKDKERVHSVMRLNLLLITAVFSIVCVLGIMCAPPVIVLLFGERFAASGLIMIILMPGLYISCLNFALKLSLNAMGHNWSDTTSVIVGLCVFFLCMLGLRWDSLPQVAAIAWGASELIICLIKIGVLMYHGQYRGVPGLIMGLTFVGLMGAMGIRLIYFP